MKVEGSAEEDNRAAVGGRGHAYEKGVKYLSERGLTVLPDKYVLPLHERPRSKDGNLSPLRSGNSIRLPMVDFRELRGPNRRGVVESIAEACGKHGFFQVVNHGIPTEILTDMIDVTAGFFKQPFEERERYMSPDMFSPVRYGTSMNQKKDSVLCWRDFLKITCPPTMSEGSLRHWPSSPADFRKLVANYARETKHMSLVLMEAILEGLLILHKPNNEGPGVDNISDDGIDREPNLTLGMPPHSDYGFLTLLLQDEVAGLQVHHEEEWVTVDPVPGSFAVNVGDHLEIFSNGRYRSVFHRVLANHEMSRVSVVSIHSFPFDATVRPWTELVDEANPSLYRDTSFACFMDYISSREPKKKNFLESRKLPSQNI
ncbi:hypothetical protein MLD38_020358 [Melastoma candidum]|uniref:Uncharacterized protein n=1 Tax=Melastoma candidum TaxID=119954 RepID=A0ACB9QKQ7_9MYRT|nr:hypothetical protein MLD38_020358 [Melastoma candidum]